jgi:hypothetical protein
MRDTVKYGLLTGIIASIYLGILANNGEHVGASLNYGKYLILILGLFLFFIRRMKSWTYNDFVANFIGSTVVITFVASVVLIISNTILYFINPILSMQKYTLIPESTSQLITIDAIILIETIVVGLLTSFVIFPYFKNKFLDDRGIQQPEEQFQP